MQRGAVVGDVAAQALDPDGEPDGEQEDDVEWPSEKKKPTLSGRWPSLISFRVVLSIAPMWSASNAWRMPSVYAVMPTPIPKMRRPELQVLRRDEPEQQAEADDVQREDDERQQPRRASTRPAERARNRVHRETGDDVVAIGLFPRIVSRTSCCDLLARANHPHQTSSTQPFVRPGRSVRWRWSRRFPATRLAGPARLLRGVRR